MYLLLGFMKMFRYARKKKNLIILQYIFKSLFLHITLHATTIKDAELWAQAHGDAWLSYSSLKNCFSTLPPLLSKCMYLSVPRLR